MFSNYDINGIHSNFSNLNLYSHETAPTSVIPNEDVKVCDVHVGWKKDIMCLDCEYLVCAGCWMLNHSGHTKDTSKSALISSLVDKDSYQTIANNRLRSLWSTLNILSTLYQTASNTNNEVSEHFKSLYEYLMVQEHKLKAPFHQQLERTRTATQAIIKELKDINVLLSTIKNTTKNKTPPLFSPFSSPLKESAVDGHSSTSSKRKNSNYNSDNDSPEEEENDTIDIEDMDQVLESIKRITSMERFISKAFTSSTGNKDGGHNDEILTDFELQPLIEQSLQYMKDAPRIQLTSTPLVQVNQQLLLDIRKQITSCFTFLDPNNQMAPFNTRMFSIGDSDYSMYSINPSLAMSPRANGYTPRTGVCTSTVYAKGNVYIFGGVENQKTYAYYNLAEQTWHDNLPIDTIQGGFDISACYDGLDTIYLVGGYSEGRRWSRVDSFNIMKKMFSHVGKLRYELSAAITFVHNLEVIIVGGFFAKKQQRVCISSFDPVITKVNRVLLQDESTNNKCGSMLISCCFDGDENVYVLSGAGVFLSFSLETGKLVSRSYTPPRLGNSLFYIPNCGPVLQGGKDHNYHYSVKDNKWSPIPGIFDGEPRGVRALCLIPSI
ncbi:hypothetical protein SAMD00019534_028810 [Acytostelium subglobosum LB1]|uniref:hypothetical protein n=1 Tax=Acytostelium subglobosum LB1 TaxID=1410327 RepID=UPI000644B59D|nr:hypothetical protein SAMD00019534_028810 [Acytostelium subglobosum LB1]GAM19706.1 hypothetical protein SAMD00019534_028810 [Acytostelium subglobosum LB1]|eukprot:XP_012756468.1 hypothetical protein SAMD00019534_028810 [Acytostelium subglobosum LB1]